MNKFTFNQTGGFPLDTNVPAEMQRAYELFNFGKLFSESHVIVSGCVKLTEPEGIRTTNGVVSIYGEILPFEGGIGSGTVIIEETTVQSNFEDGTDKTTLLKRKARLGSGPDSFDFSEFRRLPNLINSLVPNGMIAMWGGAVADIPEGWSLCDGSGGTPDLSGKFIVGHDANDPDYDAIGKTGGEKEVALSEAEGPAHTHTGTTGYDGSHNHTYLKAVAGRGYDTKSDANPLGGNESENTSTDGGHSHSFTTNQSGSGTPHENRPPYYTLAYIQFKGN